jgi:hypothetical protein
MSKQLALVDHTPRIDESRRLALKAQDMVGLQLVSGLNRLSQDVADLEEVLPKVIVNEGTLERCADFKKAAGAALIAADDTRKRITEPARDFTSLVNEAFKDGLARLNVVVTTVTQRLDAYYADVEAKRVAAEKAAAADQPVSKEVLAAVLAPTKVTSVHGVTSTSVRRVSGDLAPGVTAKRTFLRWASENLLDEELDSIKVAKSLLNTLAIQGDQVVSNSDSKLTEGEFEANTGVHILVEHKASVR